VPSAGLQCADEGLAIDRYQSEMLTISLRPLEIVEQRPVNVASDVDSFAEAPFDLGNTRIEPGDATRIV
jgi:hypothetical protein